jgi:hemolysin activation/secretion protein
LTDHNNSQDFNNLRSRSTAYYFYTRLNAERITRLPADFSWVIRALGQYAPIERLQPSEELALGGYSTLRGYDERIILGDSGWVVSNELRTPPLHFTDYVHLKIPRDELQFLAFFDYGAVRVNDPQSDDQIAGNPNKTLYSVGGGLRYAIGSNLSLRFDYGYPLTQKQLNERQHGRVHIGALVSF